MKMKQVKLSRNWIAKALSLLLAIAIWFLIKEHLSSGPPPPRAIPVLEP